MKLLTQGVLVTMQPLPPGPFKDTVLIGSPPALHPSTSQPGELAGHPGPPTPKTRPLRADPARLSPTLLSAVSWWGCLGPPWEFLHRGARPRPGVRPRPVSSSLYACIFPPLVLVRGPELWPPRGEAQGGEGCAGGTPPPPGG